MSDEHAVCIHLHHVVFIPEHTVSDVSGSDWTSRILSIHVIDRDLVAILTDRLTGVFRTRDLDVQTTDVSRDSLVHGSHKQTFRMI